MRCGWTMGQPALNCQNDDTPHRFPSQGTDPEFNDVLDKLHAARALLKAEPCEPELALLNIESVIEAVDPARGRARVSSRRLIPRQIVGAPISLAIACGSSCLVGYLIAFHEWAGVAVCALAVAMFYGYGLLLALLPHQEDELRRIRERYDKKIARLEARKP